MQRLLDRKNDIKELESNFNKLESSRYRQYFHVEPISGLLNDPNGFSYHKGKWILFYQWYPFAPSHGLKHWYMTESDDLICFKNKGLGILPKEDFENHGAYSGTALSIDGKLNLFYTGNHRDEDNIRRPKQVRAILEDEKIDHKEVIIPTNTDSTEHQRDPSIFYNKEDGFYYIFLGIQDKNKKGGLALYRSDNLDPWDYLGLVKVEGYEDFGYMWECPNFAQLDGKDLLIFSPQGIDREKYGFDNIDNNGYLLGKMDFDNLCFIPENDFTLLDHGFEFYASQLAQKDNNSYLISWLGLPGLDTQRNNIANSSLSLVRELKIKDNKLYQKPLDFKNYLAKSEVYKEKNIELNEIEPMRLRIKDIEDYLEVQIYANEEDKSGLLLSYKDNCLSLDRNYLKYPVNKKDTNIRKIKTRLKNLEIFIDKSSVEIFVNDGAYSLSSRIFPREDENKLRISSKRKLLIDVAYIKKFAKDFII